MKKKLIWAITLFLTLTVHLPVFADEYHYDVYDADWEDCSGTEGRIYGTWTAAEDSTSYRIELYKYGNLIARYTEKETRVNFSKAIAAAKGGVGYYTFTVSPLKGGESSESEELRITYAMVSKLKVQLAAENRARIIENGTGWVAGPDGIWVYYDQNGNQVKNKWITDNGYRYYLDRDGQMVTGWQAIGGAYYYFEPSSGAERPRGACYVDTVTPDGFRVGKDGAWKEPEVQTGTEIKKPAAAVLKLGFITITLKEDKVPDTYTKIKDITVNNGTVSNIVYQTDPSGWTSGTVGSVTFDVTVKSGVFVNDTKAACNRASSVRIISSEGQTAHIELHYIPKFVLTQPSGFYMTSDRIVKWIPVQNAGSYTVKAVYMEEAGEGKKSKKTVTVSVIEPEFDPAEIGIYEDTDVKSLTVKAVGKSANTFQDSAASSVGSLVVLAAEKTVEGDLKYSSAGMSYRDADGDRVKGWVQLMGGWYFFKQDGYAAGPGWYQGTDGYWYYFDSAYRMVTGTLTDQGKEYLLNDGSNASFPRGAWIH